MSRLGDRLAEQLVEAMEARAWSQADLARETGLSAKHVNQMVQGKSGSLAAYEFAAFALGYEWSLSLMELPPHGSSATGNIGTSGDDDSPTTREAPDFRIGEGKH